MNDDAEHTDRPDEGRRRILRAGAGLGLAAAFGPVAASESMKWRFEEWYPAPEGANWRVLDGHDSGYLAPGWRRKTCNLGHRIAYNSSPDSRNGFVHVVRKRDVVDPIGVDSRRIPANFSSFSRVLLRYHHWIEKHSYLDGKWIGLQLGRGWISRGHPRGANALYGSDGAGVNTMHPGRSGGNGIRLLASHPKQRTVFGDNMGSGREILPTGRWLTVDVVVDKSSGYRLYVDGRMMVKSSKLTPVRRWEDCGCIWYRTRLMHGGTPAKLRALHDYREWFGGYFVAVA
mgnify:CR=1 FL=1